METLRSKPEIHEASDELRTWDWQYGQTPEFSVDLHGKVHGVGKLVRARHVFHLAQADLCVECQNHFKARNCSLMRVQL